MQVGQHSHSVTGVDSFLRSFVQESSLIKRHASSELDGTLGFLHHFHRGKQEARTVITNHRLGQTIGRFGRCSCADLQSRDTHHVSVEGLRVLSAQGLVWSGTSSANDCHGHVELASSSSVSVSCGRNLSHTVDAKVCVHQFNNWTVSIQSFTESLTNEMTFVDNFIGCANLSIGLLCQFGDVVRGTGLQIFGMDGCSGVAKHFFVNGEVDSISNRNFPSVGLFSEGFHVSLDGSHLLFRDHTLVNIISPDRSIPCVVVKIRGIGVFQFLRQFHRRHGRFVSKLDTGLHFSHDFLLSFLQFVFGERAVFDVSSFKEFQRILLCTSPCLFFLATTFVFGVSRRVTVETVGVNLENGRSLSFTNVVNDSLTSLSHIDRIHTINQKAWYTIVLTLVVHCRVLGNILCKGINGTAIVDDDDQKGQVVLGSSIEQFSHASILRTTFSNKDDRNAVVISRRSFVLLHNVFIIRQSHLAVQQNGFGGTTSIGELFGHQCPSSLEVFLLVKNVHGTTSTTA